MNTSYKCNCCVKQDVCRYQDQYNKDCDRIKNQVIGSLITEVTIKCKKFMPHQQDQRGVDNEV